MEKVAATVVKKLKAGGYAPNLDVEWGIYSLTLLLERIIGLSGIIVIAVITNRIIELLIFYLSFREVRRYSGGYHARTFLACLILSMTFFAVLVLCIEPFLLQHTVLQFVFVSVSVGILLLTGSVNHPNLSLNKKELIVSKKKCRKAVVLLAVIYVMLLASPVSDVYAVYESCALILSAILQMIAKIIGMEVREDEKQ